MRRRRNSRRLRRQFTCAAQFTREAQFIYYPPVGLRPPPSLTREGRRSRGHIVPKEYRAESISPAHSAIHPPHPPNGAFSSRRRLLERVSLLRMTCEGSVKPYSDFTVSRTDLRTTRNIRREATAAGCRAPLRSPASRSLLPCASGTSLFPFRHTPRGCGFCCRDTA